MVFRLFSREVAREPGEAPPERKASAVGRVVALAAASGRGAVWSARDTGSLTRGGFVGNPVGFRCVKLIAEAAAAVPLVCADRASRYEVHPVLDLLRRPNPGQGRAELFEALFGQILLSGNGYLEAVGVGASGLPEEVQTSSPDWSVPEPLWASLPPGLVTVAVAQLSQTFGRGPFARRDFDVR